MLLVKICKKFKIIQIYFFYIKILIVYYIFNRQTPLMLACKSKEPEIISELMKNVKNIEACDKDGRTVTILKKKF